MRYKENGSWKTAADYIYAASGTVVVPTTPELSSPAQGSTLAGSSAVFELAANGVTIEKWNVRAGSSVGAKDYKLRTGDASTTSLTLNNLPTDGSTVYVRLRYKESGLWKTAADYTYTASTTP